MGDTIGTKAAASPDSQRVVMAAATREMRTALFVATNASNIRIVATASTLAELTTYTRSFQPDIVIVADDLGRRADLVARISALKETVHQGRIFVVGPSAGALAEATGALPIDESRDVLDALFVPAAGTDPPLVSSG